MTVPGRPSLRRLADVVGDLVDSRVGVVRFVEEIPREPGGPDFFHVYAWASDTSAFSRQRNFGATGGASTSLEMAAAKAIGEAVERYCAALFDVDELPLFSAAEAPFECAAPAEFALYTRVQYSSPGFPYVPFDDSTPIRWTHAFDPLTSEDTFVPAAMVFVPYAFLRGSGDSPICQPISTGLACHCSPAEAAVSGACEVVERDAVMMTWLARMGLPQIRRESLTDANQDLVERLERAGGEVTLIHIAMDLGVPTVLATLRSAAPSAPALVVAAAAALDPEEAVRKSLEELAHTRRYSHRIKASLPRLAADPPEFDNVVDQVGHLNFWADHANAAQADFLFTSTERVGFDSLPNLSTGEPRRDLQVLCGKVRDVGHRVLVADLTTSDVAQLGLSVVHAIIPGFHPLTLGHRWRVLGGARLSQVPQRLGYRAVAEAGANVMPHPYP
jgi:ribosomal protein S12 methylthiotransferase accessory factor